MRIGLGISISGTAAANTVTVDGSVQITATLTDFSRNDNIFDSHQTIPLSGTCDIEADGIMIEGRMVTAAGDEIHAWRDLGTASGTSWSGAFIPDGENIGDSGPTEAEIDALFGWTG